MFKRTTDNLYQNKTIKIRQAVTRTAWQPKTIKGILTVSTTKKQKWPLTALSLDIADKEGILQI